MGELPTLGKFGGKFWKEGGKEEKGKGEGKRRKGKREARKEGKMERKRRQIVKGGGVKLIIERGRYENEQSQQTTFLFACHFLKPLKFVWGVAQWKFGGKFLTSPTFDCTPGYAPVHIMQLV